MRRKKKIDGGFLFDKPSVMDAVFRDIISGVLSIKMLRVKVSKAIILCRRMNEGIFKHRGRDLFSR